MTTITRERLKQIYAECEERDPAIFEIRELVRIALASLEAEPVAWEVGGIFCHTKEEASIYVGEPEPLYEAPPAPVAPDGYALVPVEPTEEMIEAAMNCEDVVFDSHYTDAFRIQYWEIYCAMLTAAPQPEQR
ncbi:hypothetical protein IM956_003103 [Salmonella enterica]|nr:hypothetical protein [Salmonella enterica]EFQ7222254.1 hypothetical protein [Salmonella enterica]EGJ6809003.1 hypothetical protein [Salmonella enterica]EID8049426.1 hypothetical protein [Salmonella enterica]EKI8393627.1 hypothetical protein [Salmonella enterica]